MQGRWIILSLLVVLVVGFLATRRRGRSASGFWQASLPTFIAARDAIIGFVLVSVTMLGLVASTVALLGFTGRLADVSVRENVVFGCWALGFAVACFGSVFGVFCLLSRGDDRQKRRRAGLCPTCGYDVAGIDGPCPECGAES